VNGGTLAVHRMPGVSASLSFDGGHLWQVTGNGGLAGSKNVIKMYPDSGKVIGVVGLGVDSMYVAGVEVWVGLEQKDRLQRRGAARCSTEFEQGLLVDVDLGTGV